MEKETPSLSRREFFKLLVPAGLATLFWALKARKLLRVNPSLATAAGPPPPAPDPAPAQAPTRPVPTAPPETSVNQHPEVAHWLAQPETLVSHKRDFEPDLSPYFPQPVVDWGKYLAAAIKQYNFSRNFPPTDPTAPQLVEISLILWLETCGVNRDSVSGARPPLGVMPFHFSPDEDDRDMWVVLKKGVDYFGQQLEKAADSGFTGLPAVLMAMAAYNGGPSVFRPGYIWARETDTYYYLSHWAMTDPQAFAQNRNNYPGGLCQEAVDNPALAAWKSYMEKSGISIP